MKPFIYLAGIATMADGAMHLLFPDRWDRLWVAESRKLMPQISQQLEQRYLQYPPNSRRVEGLGWIALGALLLWLAGSAEAAQEG